jgi:hypothetical protein
MLALRRPRQTRTSASIGEPNTVAAQPTNATTNEPTAYTARIVATGMAAAIGAVLTSVIDSRGTMVGAVLVAMFVSAIGQAMRRPLDRLERRVKALGLGGGILVIAVLGFTVGAGAVAAHEILGPGQLSARVARKLHLDAWEERVRATPTESVADDEDAERPAKHASPAASEADEQSTAEAAPRPASDASKQRPTQPAPTPSSTAEPASGAARP